MRRGAVNAPVLMSLLLALATCGRTPSPLCASGLPNRGLHGAALVRIFVLQRSSTIVDGPYRVNLGRRG